MVAPLGVLKDLGYSRIRKEMADLHRQRGFGRALNRGLPLMRMTGGSSSFLELPRLLSSESQIYLSDTTACLHSVKTVGESIHGGGNFGHEAKRNFIR
jgi:hypothetical protein